jgi:chorismate lyase/3-hydroxybenzoate synthase
MSVAAVELPLLQVALGSNRFSVGLPVLGGEDLESVFPSAIPAAPSGEFSVYRIGDWVVGGALAPADQALEAVTQRVYRALFAATGGPELVRIWNYVPRINLAGADGLENYRAFCRGRSVAFEAQFGKGFKQRLPAASAVGTDADSLAVIFAASTRHPQHFENPYQVAAYDYPAEYGPRSPSFARATVIASTAGRDVFISGTSAIRGHHTIAPGDTLAQLTCTLENLRAVGRACGVGDDLGVGRAAARHLKIYLRHAADFPEVEAALAPGFVRPGDRVSYLRADICRAELNVEIEATIFGLEE